MKYFFNCLFFFLGIYCIGCKVAENKSEEATIDTVAQKSIQHTQAVAGNFSDQRVLRFESDAIPKFLDLYPEFYLYAEDIEKFYQGRNYAYAWYDQNGMIDQASSLFNRFQNLKEEDGVLSELPYEESFQALIEGSDSILHREPRNARAELMLTAQYFSFAQRVWQGLPENKTNKLDWFVARKKLNLDQLMDSLLSNPAKSIGDYEPVYRQYALLKIFLKKYRDIESKGGWPTIKATKKYYERGDSSYFIPDIRRRLFLSGDFDGDTLSIHFTDDLEAAVKSYQERHGMVADGVIGKSIIREMNTPVESRIEQLVVNMERCRWVPFSLEGEYMVVNIPSYKLYVYRNDSLLWDMNVVAGKPLSKTVIFNGDLKYVVFSPYWNVPPSIIQEDVIPGMKRDSSYLEKHNMEIVDNVIREKPGPDNSLGRVKFLFPNNYNIYLHDTPAKSLFEEKKRAFSHGCIRLEQPKKLAMYLLRNDTTWTEAKIDSAMNAGEEKWVRLKEKVPVFIAYFTAWVDRNGKLNLRPDIYKNDDRLAEMMLTGQ